MNLAKYLTVFQISWQNEFVYRINFLLWRLRNFLRFLMTLFLWNGVFLTNSSIFSYNKEQIITYIFLVLIVQSIVLSAPSADNIGGEITSGELSNYLVKPIGYLKYWFTRDLANKLLNLLFASIELTFIWSIFRPTLNISMDALNLFAFAISIFFALAINYLLSSLARFFAFWTPENTWGLAFVLLVFIEILAGAIFPLNILPNWAYNAVQFTPFPYLLYFPIAILQGKITGISVVWILLQSALWFLAMLGLTKYLWGKGLMVYQSSGK